MPYPLSLENKVRNYILEFVELGLDFTPLKQHFVVDHNFDESAWNDLVKEAHQLNNKEFDNPNPESSQKQLLSEIAALRSKLSRIEKKKTATLTGK